MPPGPEDLSAPPGGALRPLPGPDDPLRIALLTYRGKPHVGGQGVYVRHLAKALHRSGHHVEVLSGQPYPVVDEGIPLVELPSLDIYNDYFPMRMPGIWELRSRWDWLEVTAFSSGTFPEPLAFSMRAWDHLHRRLGGVRPRLHLHALAERHVQHPARPARPPDHGGHLQPVIGPRRRA